MDWLIENTPQTKVKEWRYSIKLIKSKEPAIIGNKKVKNSLSIIKY